MTEAATPRTPEEVAAAVLNYDLDAGTVKLVINVNAQGKVQSLTLVNNAEKVRVHGQVSVRATGETWQGSLNAKSGTVIMSAPPPFNQLYGVDLSYAAWVEE